jgi:hypothetical protein
MSNQTETKQMKNALRHEGATAPPHPKKKEEEEGEWKKMYSKHEFYAWVNDRWWDFPYDCELDTKTDEEIIKRWCSENGHQIRDDGVYVWWSLIYGCWDPAGAPGRTTTL